MADPDHELIRFGAREYQAATGRWTAKDPVLFAGRLNLCGYVNNDPVNGVDRNGLRGRAGCRAGKPAKQKPLTIEDFDIFAAWRLEAEANQRAEEAKWKPKSDLYEHMKKNHPFSYHNFILKDTALLSGCNNSVEG